MHETQMEFDTEPIETKQFHDANDAWEYVNAIYTSSISFLRSKFQAILSHQSGHNVIGHFTRNPDYNDNV